jgi:hypothetical protein
VNALCERLTAAAGERGRRVLRAEALAAPIPDVHTFLRVLSPAGWMDVDA